MGVLRTDILRIFFPKNTSGELLQCFGDPQASVKLHYTQYIIPTRGTCQFLVSLEWFSLIKWLSVPEQNT